MRPGPPFGVPIPDDDEIDHLIRSWLADVDDFEDRYNKVIFGPLASPGSAAETDRRIPLGDFAWVYAIDSLGTASQVIDTWRQIYQADIRPISTYASILRTGLETATFTRWLLDPNQHPLERVCRGVLARLEDIDERAKFEAVAPADVFEPYAEFVAAATDRDRLLREAVALGMDVATVAGKRKPVLTHVNRCKHYAITKGFSGDAAYRLVSGMAHGLGWSVSMVRREEIPDVPAPPDTVLSRVEADPDAVALLTTWALDTFEAALADVEHYVGSAL